MPRVYKRKTAREVDERRMRNAICAYLKGELGLNASAERFNVKRTTLQSRVKCLLEKKEKEEIIRSMEDSGNESDDQSRLSKYGNKFKTSQIFSVEEERELAKYLKQCSNLNYGLTYHQIEQLAYEYAKGIPGDLVPDKWEERRCAGTEWRKGFMRRNADLSLRKPESTSLMRGTGFNKPRVMEFFDNYEKVIKKYCFKPEQIYNLVETGLSTVLKPVKVVSTKEKKQVGQVSSAERGETVTFVGIINAIGGSIPPVFIFPRLRNIDEYLTDGPIASIALGNKSGWMTSELFIEVLRHIVQKTKCSMENKILLLIDNHESHVSVEAIIFCRDNGIILLSFPPHTTHKLQPLDVAVYGPFKSKLAIAQNDWMIQIQDERWRYGKSQCMQISLIYKLSLHPM
ncbi:uncharacterized protein LOC115877363 [Sitophilus oryzae]|uniref:Uncharacterized protein LOC115877363 n=1 Tax=Sitophilus oryzae TaxID=7048 RepID=A0A6J2XF32_SITOR|nr:uncharacterized protein LOC115877363 [Sitophilus oryzae]